MVNAILGKRDLRLLTVFSKNFLCMALLVKTEEYYHDNERNAFTQIHVVC